LINKKNKDGRTTKAWLQSIIDKLNKKNIIHSNNASRKIAKYVRMLKSLEVKS
jgi:ribosomal protein S20